MAKMNFTKIIRLKTSEKPNGGYNSLWLVRCNICGEIVFMWDTNMYQKTCPICKNKRKQDFRTKSEIKENIFRIQRQLYSEYKTKNILSPKEIGLLSEFRSTEFKSILLNLISDYWFNPRQYTTNRRVEWKIDKRGESLVNNPDFIDLLKECYNLLYTQEEGGDNNL